MPIPSPWELFVSLLTFGPVGTWLLGQTGVGPAAPPEGEGTGIFTPKNIAWGAALGIVGLAGATYVVSRTRSLAEG